MELDLLHTKVVDCDFIRANTTDGRSYMLDENKEGVLRISLISKDSSETVDIESVDNIAMKHQAGHFVNCSERFTGDQEVYLCIDELG